MVGVIIRVVLKVPGFLGKGSGVGFALGFRISGFGVQGCSVHEIPQRCTASQRLRLLDVKGSLGFSLISTSFAFSLEDFKPYLPKL